MVISVKESSYLNNMPKSDLINAIRSNMTVIKHYRKKMDNVGVSMGSVTINWRLGE